MLTARWLTVLLLLSGVAPWADGTEGQGPSLPEFQGEIVRKLAGGAEIRPGILLTDRFGPERRAMVRDFLSSTLESLGLEARRHPYRENGENVYALLPSTTGSDDFVLLGAHFDTVERSPGASDNATGCALVLGVARHLVALPRRGVNVLVVFFDEEERGLQGSRAFARHVEEQGWKVVSVHTADQVGWDQDEDGAVELELPYPGALELYREAAKVVGFRGRIYETPEAGSDHTAFRRMGMQAVGVTEEYRNGDTTPHIHRSSDAWQTVDLDYLAEVTRLVRTVLVLLLEESVPSGHGSVLQPDHLRESGAEVRSEGTGRPAPGARGRPLRLPGG